LPGTSVQKAKNVQKVQHSQKATTHIAVQQAQKQPPTVQKQPPTVQKQPPTVQKQPPTVQKQFSEVSTHPAKVQTTNKQMNLNKKPEIKH
jgi:hypothetical protein